MTFIDIQAIHLKMNVPLSNHLLQEPFPLSKLARWPVPRWNTRFLVTCFHSLPMKGKAIFIVSYASPLRGGPRQTMWNTWILVHLLKEHDSWDSPFKFNHPSGLQMCDGELPANYNKLDLDVTAGYLVEDITLELLNDQDEPQMMIHLTKSRKTRCKNQKMISKVEKEKMTNIHISQAIKNLLPGEYITRYRQKRHWAAKFLPGKEPLNPLLEMLL